MEVNLTRNVITEDAKKEMKVTRVTIAEIGEGIAELIAVTAGLRKRVSPSRSTFPDIMVTTRPKRGQSMIVTVLPVFLTSPVLIVVVMTRKRKERENGTHPAITLRILIGEARSIINRVHLGMKNTLRVITIPDVCTKRSVPSVFFLQYM